MAAEDYIGGEAVATEQFKCKVLRETNGNGAENQGAYLIVLKDEKKERWVPKACVEDITEDWASIDRDDPKEWADIEVLRSFAEREGWI